MEETLALIPFLPFFKIIFLPSLLLQVLPASFPGIAPSHHPVLPQFPQPLVSAVPILPGLTLLQQVSFPLIPLPFLLSPLSCIFLCLTSSFPLQN